jgi:hypothetical protein
MATRSPSPSPSTPTPTDKLPVIWPNQKPVVDGVVPAEEVPQDFNPFHDEDFDVEMED